MTAAHVQHVVGDVGSGHVICDHLHGVGAVRAGSFRNVFRRSISTLGVTESVFTTSVCPATTVA
jgi:hypothetical protein